MPFSTVRFFSPQVPQAKSRRKLRNLLLLLLRLLIFALIVFAFLKVMGALIQFALGAALVGFIAGLLLAQMFAKR